MAQHGKAFDGYLHDVKDWRSSRSVQRMTFAERGVYRDMLDEEWDSPEHSLPDDPNAVADLIAISAEQRAEVLAAWPVVRLKFTTDRRHPLRIFNARLELARQKQTNYFRSKSIAGRKGGNTRAANQRRVEDLSLSSAIAVPQTPVAKSSDLIRSDLIRSDQKREREERLSLSPPADPFTDPTTTERAGRFIERYEALYAKHRHGARYAVKPTRDYAASVTLCKTWTDDARLDKLATVFLTTDHKFAEEGSRTIPQFLAMASWCDSRLCEHESRKATA